jgi:hypothetical protein
MISGYYGRGDVATRILAALQEAGIDPATATPLDLSRFDNCMPAAGPQPSIWHSAQRWPPGRACSI